MPRRSIARLFSDALAPTAIAAKCDVQCLETGSCLSCACVLFCLLIPPAHPTALRPWGDACFISLCPHTLARPCVSIMEAELHFLRECVALVQATFFRVGVAGTCVASTVNTAHSSTEKPITSTARAVSHAHAHPPFHQIAAGSPCVQIPLPSRPHGPLDEKHLRRGVAGDFDVECRSGRREFVRGRFFRRVIESGTIPLLALRVLRGGLLPA